MFDREDMELKKLALSVNQGFKFLNTLGFSPKNKIMLLIWQALQILSKEY